MVIDAVVMRIAFAGVCRLPRPSLKLPLATNLVREKCAVKFHAGNIWKNLAAPRDCDELSPYCCETRSRSLQPEHRAAGSQLGDFSAGEAA